MKEYIAELIIDGFETENWDIFMIAADALEDGGEQEKADQLRAGTFLESDRVTAIETLYKKELLLLRSTKSVKEWINLLKTFKNEKRLIEYYKIELIGEKRLLFDLATDPVYYEDFLGVTRQKSYTYWYNWLPKSQRPNIISKRNLCLLFKDYKNVGEWTKLLRKCIL